MQVAMDNLHGSKMTDKAIVVTLTIENNTLNATFSNGYCPSIEVLRFIDQYLQGKQGMSLEKAIIYTQQVLDNWMDKPGKPGRKESLKALKEALYDFYHHYRQSGRIADTTLSTIVH